MNSMKTRLNVLSVLLIAMMATSTFALAETNNDVNPQNPDVLPNTSDYLIAPAPDTIRTVELDQTFGLYMYDTARITGTDLSFQIIGGTYASADSTTSNTDPAGLVYAPFYTQLYITKSSKSFYAQIRESGTYDVGEYRIHFLSRGNTNVQPDVTEDDTQTMPARDGVLSRFKVTRISSDPTNPRTVALNESFALAMGEKTMIIDSDSSKRIARMGFSGTSLVPCLMDVSSREGSTQSTSRRICDERPRFTLNFEFVLDGADIAPAQTITLTEGDVWKINGFEVSILGYLAAQNTLKLRVSRAGDYTVPDTKQVVLGEEFDLTPRSRALVTNAGVSLYLSDIQILESFPQQYRAVVNIENVNTIKAVTQKPSGALVMPSSTTLSIGDTVSRYGYAFTLLNADAQKTVWIVETDSSDTLTVRLHEAFWLSMRQTAQLRVDTDYRIGILEVLPENCPLQSQSGDDLSGLIPYCRPARVNLSVTYSINSETPTTNPVEGLTVAVGEEVVIGAIAVKVLDVRGQEVQLLVREKPATETVELKVGPGWNLFSLPGEISPLSKSACNTDNWKIYWFNPSTKSFERVYDIVAGTAYWIYNPDKALTTCTVTATMRNPVSFDQLPSLVRGWNFVPMTTDMIGRTLEQTLSCDFSVAYRWNALSSRWEKTTDTAITASDLGLSWAVYSRTDCELTPPSLPPIDDSPDAPADTVWMKINPIQCNGNAWELWHDALDRVYVQAPSQEDILREYLESEQRIRMYGYEFIPAPADIAVCAACSCPTGEEIRIRVNASDISVLNRIGFEVRSSNQTDVAKQLDSAGDA